jgi:hypothetical protein
MQLDNLSGATQDMVIGGLLLGAILAGNIARAAQGRGTTWKRALVSRREVPPDRRGPLKAEIKTREGG